MGGTQSQSSTTNENISDIIQVSQSTTMQSTATSTCLNDFSFKRCGIKNFKAMQNATCITDITAYQKAMQSQTSSNTLSNELMNQLQQTTQNAALNFTSQQEKVVNNLKINMATDIQQSILMDCNVSQSGTNKVSCEDSTLNFVTLDQNVAVQQTSNCVQDASQSSTATQDLKNTVSNIMTQKVDNALAACAAVILAVGCVIAIVFLGPGAEVGAISKDMVKEPAGILMMTFACVAYVGCCNAMTESKAHCCSCYGISFPPKIPDSIWDEVWVGMFIYVLVMLGFAYFEAKHPQKGPIKAAV